MRPDTDVGRCWTFDPGIGWTPAGRVEAFVNDLTEETHKAGSVILRFDNTRFFIRLRTFGARVRYRL